MSNLSDAKAAFHANVDYDADNSPVKCRLFIVACRQLLLERPTRAGKGGTGGGEMEFDLTLVKQLHDEARKWLAANPASAADGGPSVIHPAFDDFRGW